MKKLLLLFTTFMSGGSIMVVEMLGSRILAPYYGSSIYIWAILIGVVLTSLSVGYYIGGKYADKRPSYNSVVNLLLGGALAVALLALCKDAILLFTSQYGLFPTNIQATVDAIFLFVPSTLLLAMVSPLLARLSLIDVEHSGSTIGLLYAVNTIGSIVGTFLGGVFLISYFGVTLILVSISFILVATAIIIMSTKRIKIFSLKKVVLFGIIVIASISALNAQGLKLLYPDLVADNETLYGRLWAFDQRLNGDTSVRFLTNTIHAYQSGMFVEHPDLLLFPYTHYLDVYNLFNPNASKVLLIGGGAYSYPKYFNKQYKDKTLHVVEIDPEMKEMAEDYFEYIETPNIISFTEDGRVFLSSRNDMYDAILIDAFLSNATIPFHLTTKEFVQEVSTSLADEGIVIVNMISDFDSKTGTFLSAEYKTYSSVFTDVFVIKVSPSQDFENQNYMLVASKTKLENKEKVLQQLLTLYSSTLITDVDTSNVSVLTDDFAPIERYAH